MESSQETDRDLHLFNGIDNGPNTTHDGMTTGFVTAMVIAKLHNRRS